MSEINNNQQSAETPLSVIVRVDGANKALDSLWPLHERNVAAWARTVLFSSRCTDYVDHANDIAQLVVLAFHKELQKLEFGQRNDFENLSGWLWTVTRNNCWQHLRTDHRQGKPVSLDEVTEWDLVWRTRPDLATKFSPLADDVQRRLEETQSIAIAANTFDAVSLSDKRIIESRRNGMAFAQIAANLHISEVAARQRYSRALRRYYGQYLRNGGQEL